MKFLLTTDCKNETENEVLKSNNLRFVQVWRKRVLIMTTALYFDV